MRRRRELGVAILQGGTSSRHRTCPAASCRRHLQPLAAPSCPAAGDWLQGPHVYALYQHYGFGMGDIGKLFIAGFGSSMVFGTVVGALADKQ